MKKIFKIAILVLMGLMLEQCENKKADDIDREKLILGLIVSNGPRLLAGASSSSSSSGSTCSDPAPKFSSVTAVTSSCTSCHGSAGGVDMTSYSSVSAKVTAKSPSGSALYTAVTTGTMASKSNSTINTAIYCWILGGANP